MPTATAAQSCVVVHLANVEHVLAVINHARTAPAAAMKKKYMFPRQASQSTRSARISRICTHRSPRKFAWNRRLGSAAGTRVMPRLKARPDQRHAQQHHAGPGLTPLEDLEELGAGHHAQDDGQEGAQFQNAVAPGEPFARAAVRATGRTWTGQRSRCARP